MNMKELASMFNVKEQDKSMKNKKKAKEIIGKILRCHKCGTQMRWIEDTNVCVCPNCTYTVEKKENGKSKKVTYSVTRTLSDKSRRFLENNTKYLEESKEV